MPPKAKAPAQPKLQPQPQLQPQLQQSAAAPPRTESAALRAELAAEREALRERYFQSAAKGKGGQPTPAAAADLLKRHSDLIDRWLKTLWPRFGMPREFTLAAVGGYGRGQLYPYSDIDLLILVPPGKTAAEASTRIEEFIGALWDIGLEVGHGVRSTEECLKLAQSDVTVQTSLLEARPLAGDLRAFDAFARAFRRELDAQAFCRAKLLEQEQRHERFHDTNLEPNIKECAGGLRDLHNILWIARAARLGADWGDLVDRGILLKSEAAALRAHEGFLQNLRIRLHYFSRRHEDRLVFDVQGELAAQLGYTAGGDRRASEHLMQDFYRTAMEIRQINAVVLQNLEILISPPARHKMRELNERFEARDGRLYVRSETLFKREPSAMLEAFRLLQDNPDIESMGATTLRALWRARDGIDADFRRSARNRELFMDILRAPSRVTRELKRMHKYGVLGRYIPAFGKIVGQMQHDLFHVYTVDEHILKVVRNLRRFAVPEFAHEFPLASRLIADFERPEVLYLAGLFHDIAKGRGGDHSELGKADAQKFCKAHGLSREDCELVTWLVEQHLMMSSTAQKQDLSDPDTVSAFAAKVVTERRLKALYLLTVADIRATSPKVWNGWKAKLLEDLFLATQRLITGGAPAELGMQQRQEDARARLRLYSIPESAYEGLWERLDTPYFLRHSADEIAWHTRMLAYRSAPPPPPIIKARISPAGEGLQVMIYAADSTDVFARICGFFERISYTIVEAKIYTLRDGHALDSFQILDPTNKRPQYRDLINYIEYELAQVLAQEQSPAPPAVGRVSRQFKHFPMKPAVGITADERGSKVLSIIAGDRPGLLSRIARTLVDYGINVRTAKVNTLGDRAEDIFVINGTALDNPKTVVKLESELMERLQA